MHGKMYSNVLFLVLLLTSVSLRQSRSAAFVTTEMSLCRLQSLSSVSFPLEGFQILKLRPSGTITKEFVL